MKLTLTSKELLSLYSLLHNVARDEDDAYSDLYGKVRAAILACIDNPQKQQNDQQTQDQNHDKFRSWLKDQETKIANLEQQNAQEIDIGAEINYPRRPPTPKMPNPGRYYGSKR